MRIFDINNVYLQINNEKMFKSIILFFRRKKINTNKQQKRSLQIPDFNKYPVITVLVDDNKKKNIKEIENFIKNSYKPKSICFVVLGESLQSDFLQNDALLFIEKKDFNKIGVLKKEKEDTLRSFYSDMLINLSDDNDLLLNDYLVSCINSSFKVGHPKVNIEIHDLTIDYGIEKNDLERIKILHKYLLMLSGGENEK